MHRWSSPSGLGVGGSAAALTIVLASSSCVIDFDGLGGTCVGAKCASEGGGGGPGPANDGGDTASGCPSLHGPAPVRVTARAGSFCIDSTEATIAQYAEFVAAKGADTSGQPPECAWNRSYVATAPSSQDPSRAVGGVDWCDALAFCTWSGKALCGSFGGTALALDAVNDPAKSVWFAACSADGAHAFPYGDAVQKPACNAFARNAGPADVGSSATCQGGYPNLFDMSGNVEEWTAACESTPMADGDGCLARGGHYASTDEADVSCTTAGSHLEVRSSAEAWRGIRCCSK